MFAVCPVEYVWALWTQNGQYFRKVDNTFLEMGNEIVFICPISLDAFKDFKLLSRDILTKYVTYAVLSSICWCYKVSGLSSTSNSSRALLRPGKFALTLMSFN